MGLKGPKLTQIAQDQKATAPEKTLVPPPISYCLKRSELTLTGETFRLTPDHWGETSIMVDEAEVMLSTADAFGISIDECDPDEDPNDLPDSVEIATDDRGNYFAILEPFTRHGKTYNENRYRPCEDPSVARHGAAELYGNQWLTFDDEDDITE